MSAVAAARTTRTISRFTVEERTARLVDAAIRAGAGRLQARKVPASLAADLTHRIRFTGGAALIELKVVRLVNSDGGRQRLRLPALKDLRP